MKLSTKQKQKIARQAYKEICESLNIPSNMILESIDSEIIKESDNDDTPLKIYDVKIVSVSGDSIKTILHIPFFGNTEDYLKFNILEIIVGKCNCVIVNKKELNHLFELIKHQYDYISQDNMDKFIKDFAKIGYLYNRSLNNGRVLLPKEILINFVNITKDLDYRYKEWKKILEALNHLSYYMHFSPSIQSFTIKG